MCADTRAGCSRGSAAPTLSPQICAAWAAGIVKMPKVNKSARARGSRRTGRFGGWIVALATALPPDPSALPAQAQLPPTSDPGRARSWLRRPPGRAARPRTRCAPCFAPCSARPLATSRASYLRARHKVRVEQGGTGVARAESVTRSHLLGRSGRAWRGKGAPARAACPCGCPLRPQARPAPRGCPRPGPWPASPPPQSRLRGCPPCPDPPPQSRPRGCPPSPRRAPTTDSAQPRTEPARQNDSRLGGIPQSATSERQLSTAQN